MTRRTRCWPWLAMWLLCAACLSTAPPAPPVRWFDPLPTGGGSAAPRFAVAVRGGEPFEREFAVRVGPHELQFDGDHRWLMPPVQLVARALRAVGGYDDSGDRVPRVVLEMFELDRTAAPTAHLRLRLDGDPHLASAVRAVVDERVDVGDPSAPAFAAAMATALERAAERVADLLAPSR